MTDYPEYTLTRPPSCPRKWDHLTCSLTTIHPARNTTEQTAAYWSPLIDDLDIFRYFPIIEPASLVRSEATLELAKELVRAWLQTYMFNNIPDGPKRAESIARWLTNHKNFKSHSRHIPRSELMDHGLNIDELEIDEMLQDLVLSVFHAATHS